MLRYGALVLDLATREVFGDLDHCPQADLMESAEALLKVASAFPRGVWGIGKAYDADCYVFSAGKSLLTPQSLPETDGSFERGPRWFTVHGPKKIKLYFKLVGKVA